MISLRTHSILDYGVAALLVVSPWIFGFATVDAARSVFVTAGLSLLTYSLITDYRYSVAKIVPVGVHMFMDVVLGILVMIAPAVFSYRDLITGGQYGLHFVMELGAIGLVAFTRLDHHGSRKAEARGLTPSQGEVSGPS